MTVKSNEDDAQLRELRLKAERAVREGTTPAPPLGDLDVVQHELRVHQAELELQNESLRQTEQELQRSLDRYFELFELAPVAYVSLDEHDLMVEVNFAAADLLGRERGRLIGTPLADHIHPGDVYALGLLCEEIRSGAGRHTTEARVRREGGVELAIHVEAVRSEEAAAGHSLLALIDKSELSAAWEAASRKENELSFARASFENVVGSMQDSLMVTDPDGVIREANEATVALLGYARGELVGRPLRDILSLGLRFPELPTRREARYRARDGREIPVLLSASSVRDDAGVVQAVVCVAYDLTDRLQREELMRRTLEAAPVAMVMVDEQDRIVFVNTETERLFGYAREELVDCDVALLLPDDRQEPSAEDPGAPRSLNSTGRSQRGRRKDGTEIPLEVGLSLLETAEGHRFVAAINDVSERYRLEEEIRQAQKMEAVGTLASGVAHDFNNLLMGLIGCVDVAMSRLPQDSPAMPFLDQVRASADDGAAITRQLLTFARQSDDKPTILDLNENVGAQRRILNHILTEAIELELHLNAKGRICADPAMVQRVLMNLVINARDATPEGGRVSIRTYDLEADPDSSIPDGPWVVLEVSDTGGGMSEAVRRRVFEPFFTTKAPGHGTGLGLSTSYAMVQRAGGELRVESEEGAGTCLRVLLPRARQPAPLPEAPHSDPQLGVAAPGTVLVVEDEPLVRMTIKHNLEAAGFEVLEAGDGASAVEISAHFEGRIDLLLTDMVLPRGMNGALTADEIRRARPEIRTLFMSAHHNAWLLENGRLAPNTQTLQKPFGRKELLRRVRRLLKD
jgi:PAS domain S-box-containing protein